MALALFQIYVRSVLNDASRYYDPDEAWPEEAVDIDEYIEISSEELYDDVVELLSDRTRSQNLRTFLNQTTLSDIYSHLHDVQFSIASSQLSDIYMNWERPTWVGRYEENIHPDDITVFDQFVFTVKQVYDLLYPS